MHKIREYKPHKGIMIFRDFNVVDGEQVYIGNGQGCGTFWFRNEEEAKKFIDKYRDEMDVTLTGAMSLIPGEICRKCKGHYSWGTPEWKKASDYVCRDYKEKLKEKARKKGKQDGKQTSKTTSKKFNDVIRKITENINRTANNIKKTLRECK